MFSGDIGPGYKILQNDPEGPAGVDYLICEATYGDRDRPDVSPEQRRFQLGDVVRGAAGQMAPLIIPSFAVEVAIPRLETVGPARSAAGPCFGDPSRAVLREASNWWKQPTRLLPGPTPARCGF